ncbi:MAG TPA: sulfatase-like hydrolase/transferase, partial [Polyangia bacterium]|nr:sulfatase-like hydrolase/transferase [Polyangia bacterium]
DAIPPGLGWVPPRIALDNRPRDPANPYPRFFRDQLGEDERRLFLELIGDSYDYAVWRADRTLGRVLGLLEERGALGPDHRLVLVSDHGEYLGEHGLLSHGIFVHEEDTRVPLFFRERRGGTDLAPPVFDGPIAALTAYDLALGGTLPARPRPVRAAGYPDGLLSVLFGERLRATTAAWWDGERKLFWKNGEFSVYDLKTDPREQSPSPLAADDPLRARFEAFVEQVQATGRRKTAPTPEMIEALRRLGYVE